MALSGYGNGAADMNHPFKKETDLCAAFIGSLPQGWTAYPESGGFDILLIHNATGFQIGIEAKLKLNAKVILQAAEGVDPAYLLSAGPDCRAVLVPGDVSGELGGICARLGITVIRQEYTIPELEQKRKWYSGTDGFRPRLPSFNEGYQCWDDERWHEFAPVRRLHVPEYIPDVGAGHSAPVQLTYWKISAIKIAVTLEKRGYVTRQDFKHHDISMSRWTQGLWLKQNGTGRWVKGVHMPDFRKQHPVNYVQIENDYETWKIPEKVDA